MAKNSVDYNSNTLNGTKMLFGGKIGAKNGNYTGDGFIAKDNNWRFEIADDKASIIGNIGNIISKKENRTTLSHFFAHPTLYKYYPKFKTIPVLFKDMIVYKKENTSIPEYQFPTIFAELHYDNNKPDFQLLIYIDYEEARKTTSESLHNLLLKGAIGDIQHAIQITEGFGRERGLQAFLGENEATRHRLRDQISRLNKNDPERLNAEYILKDYIENDFDIAYDRYINQFVEIESRLSIDRIPLTTSERLNSPPNEIMQKMEKGGDLITGGLSDKMTLQDIAKKHGVPLSYIESQHKQGIKVEMEHTNNPRIAYEIAKDHLVENPKYYDYLSAMEKKMDKGVAVTANGKAGGLLAGKAHSECDENGCGIKAVVSDGGGSRPVELESEESIINKRTMTDPSIYTVTGTPAEIASAINTIDDNGVAFAKKVPVRKVKHVVKMQKGGKFSSTPAELAGILDELFKDHCDAFAFAQVISRANSSNVAENTALLVAEWNSKIKAHFTEEEDELFPLIKDVSNDFLIDELIAEHIRFEHAVTSIEGCGSATPDEIRSLAKLLMIHIQKEDALFMRYGENKYSSSMELVESKDNVHECVYCVRGTRDQIRAAAERHLSSHDNIDVHENFEKGGLLAPNKKPSNLTPEQYKLVRTLAFKKWFGDWEKSPKTSSKVVDANGEPLVVYHGAINKFNVFERKQLGYLHHKLSKIPKTGGFFFTDNYNVAKSYVYRGGRNIIENAKSYLSGHIK